MSLHTSRIRRSAATAVVSLLAAGALATGAPAQDRVLELISTGPVGGNGADDAEFRGLSADGTRAFFETEESLVGADTDGRNDVYERSGGQTALVSTGPAGGNGNTVAWFAGASADGSRVFFNTPESLVSTDTETAQDVYERSGGQTTLVTTGPAGGNGLAIAEFEGASDDGSRVFFETDESLVSADSDQADDLYERAGGQTTLVSTGPAGGNGSAAPSFMGSSDDGSRVFFWTEESLVSGDTDATRDLYERAGGQTTLVSTGTLGGNGGVHVSLDGAGLSSDGSRVFFVTFESLVSADTDQVDDLYERAGGQTTLVSTGPAGSDGNSFASFGGASADGSRVFFVTDGSLVSADTDGWTDVYQRADGQTTLVSTGPAGGNGNAEALFARASADGSRVVFNTTDALVSADTDATWDVYERAGAESTLVSTGPAGNGNAAAWFTGASADATRVFFDTAESLVSADTDTEWDVYERSGGQTTLVSTGPAGGNGNAEAWFMDVSVDGTRALFGTAESLLSSDTDSAEDMYLSRVLLPEVATPPAPAPGPGGAPAPAPAPAAPSPLLGACANLRTGTAGRDTLTGGAFGDRLRGLAGNDVLAGRAGDDCLNGGGGHDRLRGGAGNDRLIGGPDNDRLAGGTGNDRINARDGRRETVRCGAGKDRVTADRGDRTIGCERIARR